jgi:hypothetical protein
MSDSKREQWNKLLSDRRVGRAREMEGTFRQLKHAEVAAGMLTKSQEWNWFLEIVQAMIEESEATLRDIEESDRDDYSFGHEELARAKSGKLVWGERIRTLKEMLEIPSQSLVDGERAGERLQEIESRKQA